jgi:exopolyphosphatase/guanosine-5'-triphosphate,3'-diphosphate pyrophosphatase
MLFCIRLAYVLCRSRSDELLPDVKVKNPDSESFEVAIDREWAQAHPLTEFSLRKEAAEWERIGYRYTVKLTN